MSNVCKQVYMFREVSAAPDYLAITAWGRTFRVMPSKPLSDRARVSNAEVIIQVVGPPKAPGLEIPPGCSRQVDVVDGYYEAFLCEHDDITAVDPRGHELRAAGSGGSRDRNGS